LAHRFASFSEDVKSKYELPKAFYSFGWSHGKEKFHGKPDYSKGSYYNNPIYDKPFDDPEVIRQYASFAHPNIWPTDDLPELEPAFKAMGKTAVDVGLLLARHCDSFVKRRITSYQEHRLHDIIKGCKTIKARLLHYFPRPDLAGATNGPDKKSDEPEEEEVQVKGKGKRKKPAEKTKTTKGKKAKNAAATVVPSSPSKTTKELEEESFANWGGWHNDHGSLTGLVPGLFMDTDGKVITSPDPSAGLYIKNRKGEIVKGTIPPNCMAFQMGESQQIHSGGALQATPHAIKGPNPEVKEAHGTSRQSFAVFMEPMWGEPMNIPKGTTPAQAQEGSSTKFLPKSVPPLSQRWNPEMDFGQFTAETLKCYTVVGGGLNM